MHEFDIIEILGSLVVSITTLTKSAHATVSAASQSEFNVAIKCA